MIVLQIPSTLSNDHILIYLFAAIIASSAFTTLVQYLLSLFNKKNKDRVDKANAEKIEIEVKKLNLEERNLELETEQKLSEYYKSEFTKVMTELTIVKNKLDQNNKELKQIRDMVIKKSKENKELIKKNNELTKKIESKCVKDDCPNKVITNKNTISKAS